MKPIKLVVVSALVGASIFSFAACQKDPKTVTVNVDGVETRLELNKESIPTKPQDPVKEGWIFRGWFLDPAGNTPYNFDKALDAGSTVYAVFDEKEYQVTFVVDGVSDVVTFKWSQTPTYPTPKKDKYVFKTWCLDPTLTQDYTFTAPTTSGMTVYAKFVDAYKVQYAVTPNLDTTEEIETEIVETEKETAPVRPADPRVEGYDFEGWYLDKKLTKPYNFDTVLSEGQTLYAKLVEKQYTVTYAVGRTGDVLSTATYNYWDVPTQPATPEYQGEWFFGWYLDTEYKTSYDFSYTLKEDTTVYAQFVESKEVYTVEDLKAIADYPTANYTLMNNINFGYAEWTPIKNFSGKLDGNGYKLIAFTISSTSTNTGLFETNTGTIKNLILENYTFSATYSGSYVAGSLVGTNKGTIENCALTKAIMTYKNSASATTYLGCLVGKNESAGVIKGCSINASVDVANSSGGDQGNVIFLGGCAGSNSGTVTDVWVKMQMVGNASASGYSQYGTNHWSNTYLEVGGVVSRNYGTLTESSFEGSMTVAGSRGSYANTYLYLGGVALINENGGEIRDSYAKGTITETAGSPTEVAIGGLVQQNAWKVQNCYADMTITTGTATGGTIGGFVSINRHTISTSYAIGTITTASTGYVGGFVALNATNGTVNGSFTSVDITTTSPSALGVFLGASESGSTIINCCYNSEAIVLKNNEAYTSATLVSITGLTAAELYSTENILDSLYWNISSQVWNVDGVNAPTLVWQNA